MAEVPTQAYEKKRIGRGPLVVGSLIAGLALASCQSSLTPDVEASTTSVTRTTTTALPSPAPGPELPTKLPSIDLPTLSDVDISNLPGLAGCAPYLDTARFQNREYEVCAAYIGNSASVALQGMYKFGNSRVSYLANGAKSHFETRYWGQPRTDVEREVASWPKTTKLTGNKVENDFDLRALTSQYKQNRAFITTQERWRVTAPDGTVLHDEPSHEKSTTMCRVRLPGHPLHEWVVAASGSAPLVIDCVDFAEANGLEQ